MTSQLLAQDSKPPPPKATTGDLLLAVGVLLGVALIGGFLWMWMRRRLFAPEGGAVASGFMEDLRRMRNEGQITEAEYDTIRKNMAARLAKGGFGADKGPPGHAPGPAHRRDGR